MTAYSEKIGVNEYCWYFKWVPIVYFVQVVLADEPVLNEIPVHVFEPLEEHPQIRWVLDLKHWQ